MAERLMKSLFNISREHLEIMEELEQFYLNTAEDELPEYLYEKLNVNRDEMASKLEAYYYKIEDLKSKVELLKKRAKEFTNKARRVGVVIERLKDLSSGAVKLYGEPIIDSKTKEHNGNYRFKTEELTIVRQLSKPVDVYDEAAIPLEYKSFDVEFKNLTVDQLRALKEVIEVHLKAAGEQVYNEVMLHGRFDLDGKPDKTMIGAAIRAEKTVPGARIDDEANFVKYY